MRCTFLFIEGKKNVFPLKIIFFLSINVTRAATTGERKGFGAFQLHISSTLLFTHFALCLRRMIDLHKVLGFLSEFHICCWFGIWGTVIDFPVKKIGC